MKGIMEIVPDVPPSLACCNVCKAIMEVHPDCRWGKNLCADCDEQLAYEQAKQREEDDLCNNSI